MFTSNVNISVKDAMEKREDEAGICGKRKNYRGVAIGDGYGTSLRSVEGPAAGRRESSLDCLSGCVPTASLYCAIAGTRHFSANCFFKF